jgi:pyruvate,orthophosphate dikinase
LRAESVPDDIHGMDVAKGILTSRGGMTSHAAVVARGMGIPCVAGAGEIEVSERKKEMTVSAGGKKLVLREGDWLSLDGSTGEVLSGQARTIDADPSSGVLATFMQWADTFRGSFGVRANADIPRDAKVARRFGAEGIGLCRTEHMFFAEDRITHMQAMILARDEKSRRKALLKLLPMQRADFAGLFKEMDGFPVVIRTLDPPLHEFLPKRENLMVDLAKLPHADAKTKKEMSGRYGIPVGQLKKELPPLLARVEELHEFNPMLGHRGCRLAITYPEILEMQVRAIIEAAIECQKQKVKVIPEIMIPLTLDKKEMAILDQATRKVADGLLKAAGVKIPYTVGTMVELPRAVLLADEIAEVAEFFSFGTNDLTQTVMGLSRDDAGRFLPDYVDEKKAGIFPGDPFQTLDIKGVGMMVRMGIEKGRKTRPKLKIGICGEHGGDAESVKFCHQVGMDYVSASPFRVPIARLAAAQAVVEEKKAAKSKRR